MSKLTEEERKIVSIAKVAASHEDDFLIKIIERLAGEKVEAADEFMHKKKNVKAKVECSI
jgi:hypothetical protein